MSFLLGVAYFIRALFVDSPVEGGPRSWSCSIFNGVTIALLSMLGEYVVRTLNAVSAHDTYHVLDRVKV